jgi:hypothetical protein
MTKELDTLHVQFQLNNDILVATFKKGTRIQLESAKKIVQDRIRFTESRVLAVLIRDKGVISIDRQATLFLSSKKGTKFLKAVAFVNSDLWGRTLLEYFVNANNPVMPIKVFTEEPPALEWLHEFNL